MKRFIFPEDIKDTSCIISIKYIECEYCASPLEILEIIALIEHKRVNNDVFMLTWYNSCTRNHNTQFSW